MHTSLKYRIPASIAMGKYGCTPLYSHNTPVIHRTITHVHLSNASRVASSEKFLESPLFAGEGEREGDLESLLLEHFVV